MSSLPLDGKVALITGAGSGLGAAFARRLARDGAIIVINDLNAEHASHTASEVGGTTAIFDVTDSGAFEDAVARVDRDFGSVDILVNNAGIAPQNTGEKFEKAVANQMKRMEARIADMDAMNYLVDMSDDEWDRMIRVHLYGSFYGCRAALRFMQPRRSGAIVNVSSILGTLPSAGAPHYAAAKAGIISLTRSVADEVAHLGIRVNAVCPGYIDTPLLTPFSETMKAGITMRIGMGRMGTADEIAEVVRFLVGPESSYCTGSILTASGGYVA